MTTVKGQVRQARQLPDVGSHLTDDTGRRWIVVSRTGSTQTVTLNEVDEKGQPQWPTSA